MSADRVQQLLDILGKDRKWGATLEDWETVVGTGPFARRTPPSLGGRITGAHIEWAIIDELGRIGDPRVVPTLVPYLDTGALITPCRVVVALARIGTPEALAHVRRAAEDKAYLSTSKMDGRTGISHRCHVARECLEDIERLGKVGDYA